VLAPGQLSPLGVYESEDLALAEAATMMLELMEHIAIFTAALAGEFCCVSNPFTQPSSPEPPSQREACMLVMDIKGYRAHLKATDAVSHHSWTMRGVELAAQWARACGGLERPEVKGDEIVIEFGPADSAALAAAAVLCHASALRSMNTDAFSWHFHNGTDHGNIEIRENNVMGECINNASAFAKHETDGANDVKLTAKAKQQCPTDLSALSSWRNLGMLPVGKDGAGKEFQVSVVAIDGVEIVSALTERVRRVADEIKDAFAAEHLATDRLPVKKVERPANKAERPGSDL
jgi:hypothetical protein